MDQILEFFRDFGIDWPKFIATTVNFVIVLVVLRIFAYKPILTMLGERKQRIAESMANADKIKAELAATQEQRAKALGEANAQAQKLIDEARHAANQIKERTVAEARQAAEAEVRRGQQQIAVERDRMLTEARRDIVALVIGTTAKVTGKVLTPDDQRRLTEETTRELAA
ncbi:MAG: ATP synthase F0 subunit B [Verrucomicrobiae bacterium]|nr:ATP synthase F0 subunit B [Verrucomicrobiae bacterium]